MNSKNSFRSGDVTVMSYGMVELELETAVLAGCIAFLMYIVPVNFLLLGLDVLDGKCLYADNVTNRLEHREILSGRGENLYYKDRWSVLLSRFDNYLYAKMKLRNHTFYTTAQLHKMHQNFGHPSARKLFNLLRTGGIEAVEKTTFEQLKSVTARCEPCQHTKNAPLRLRVSIGY